MKKKIGVLLIRGAGNEGHKSQEKFVNKLDKTLSKKGLDPNNIYYGYADWHGPIQENQEIIMQKVSNDIYNLKTKLLRNFVMYLVSDIVAYTGKPNQKSEMYYRSHQKIHKTVVEIEENTESGAPFVIISSSQGTEVISNYLSDLETSPAKDDFGKTAFQRMETLSGVFMLGANNTIFMAGYDTDTLEPFTFPHPNLPQNLRQKAIWHCLFDKNDPLGFPLRPINNKYKEAITREEQINVGSFWGSWNAASHMGYWKSRKIKNIISDYLIDLMKVV